MVRHLNLCPIFSGSVNISYPLTSCSASDGPTLSSRACGGTSEMGTQFQQHITYIPAPCALSPSCAEIHSVSLALNTLPLQTYFILQYMLHIHNGCGSTFSHAGSTKSSKVHVCCQVYTARISQHIVELVTSEPL